MYYDPSTKNLYVNFVNPIYQNWDSRTIKNLRKYFDNYTSGNATTSRQNNTERPSFLQRNKKRMLMVLGKKPKTYYIKNRITYKVIFLVWIKKKTGFNSIRLIPENPHTEDVIHRIRPKKTTENYVISTIIKVTKFRVWLFCLIKIELGRFSNISVFKNVLSSSRDFFYRLSKIVIWLIFKKQLNK